MWKELLFVGAAAGGGQFIASKWGQPIEAKAIEMKVPPTIAKIGVVAGAAMLGFAVAKAIL